MEREIPFGGFCVSGVSECAPSNFRYDPFGRCGVFVGGGDEMDTRKTRADFAKRIHAEVIPLRRQAIAGIIASNIEYDAERGGFDVSDRRREYGLNELSKRQRAAVVAFIEANCPRHPATGFAMPCW